MKRFFALFAAVSILAGCQPAGQMTQPSGSSSSPTVSDAAVLVNPTMQRGCDGAMIFCAAGEPCAVPSCAPDPAPLAQNGPLQIEEARFAGLATRFGLSSVSRAEEHLGGLTPGVSLAKGLKAPCNEGEGLYRNGGRLNACVVYLAQTANNDYELLDTRAKVVSRFAPVGSPEEAVSLAAMLTGHTPRYSLDNLATGWRYFARSIAPTRVNQDVPGFGLNLFDYQIFGCGPHPHFEVSYSVTASGELRETSRRKLYEDPAQDGLCVD